MAKKHRILLPVLALLLIGACSRNEEIEQPTSPSGGVEVAILCDNTKEPQVYSLPDGTRTWISIPASVVLDTTKRKVSISASPMYLSYSL